MWIRVNSKWRAKPASMAAAGGYFPVNCAGQNRTRVRRVAAANPITPRIITPVQMKRVELLPTAIKTPANVPTKVKETLGN